MQIEERSVGEVTILDLKGRMTMGEGDELLKDKINSLVNQGFKKILLNLEGVPYIDRDRKSTRLNSSHIQKSRMPSSA